MNITNQDAWQAWVDNNTDAYGRGVITYAERWADAMETATARGETLQQCAERTSHEADTEGITGFMYGMAVSVLASCWSYGEELRRWHNLATQIHDEGERANERGTVLNPALLNLGGSS
jgi:hypothetical protein